MKKNRVVVITGASKGIGLSMAEFFAANGDKVYDLSRSGQQRQGIIHIDCDVTCDSSVTASIEEIIKAEGKIEVLMLNAGYGISGCSEYTDIADAIKQFDVNFFGTVRVVNTSLKHLRNSKGQIIFISSLAAIMPIPFQSFYSASKAAMCNYVRCLKSEVGANGIKVCSILPGDVKSEFTMNRQKTSKVDAVYGTRVDKAVSIMEHDEQGGMSPVRIAKKAYKLSVKRRVKALYTVGLKYQIFKLLSKVLPNSFIDFIIRKTYGI